MKTTTILAALALCLAPTLALAEGCGKGHAQNTSCQVGTTWDAQSGTCVANPTG